MSSSFERRERFRVAGPRRDRGIGFTLLEVLIAMAILTIGLASIVALFPVAMKVGEDVMETSNAVVIAESVAEAIRDGVRNRKRYITGRDGARNVYFVLAHDGVTDEIPVDPRRERPSHDYFILFPRFGPQQKFAGPTEAERRYRALQSRQAKTFLYPETDTPPNGGGDPVMAANDALADGENDFWNIPVRKVYRLGNRLINPDLPPSERLADMQEDVLRQHSYAFTISPSYFGADISEVRGEYEPGNLLYHVTVMVFRGFPEELSEGIEPPDPIYELHFEVAL